MKLIQSLLIALGLSLSSLSAQAAVIYNFSGAVAPTYSQFGQTYSGSFSFDDVAADFDGPVALTQFHLSFLGQDYVLDDADAYPEPMAWFSAGQFLGVDFFDFDDDSRASVSLTAGLFDPSDVLFSYGSPAGVEGFGSLVFERASAAVPLPGTLALAGLGLLALSRRRAPKV